MARKTDRNFYCNDLQLKLKKYHNNPKRNGDKFKEKKCFKNSKGKMERNKKEEKKTQWKVKKKNSGKFA